MPNLIDFEIEIADVQSLSWIGLVGCITEIIADNGYAQEVIQPLFQQIKLK